MKRVDLLKHLREQYCIVVEEGVKHTIVENRLTGKVTTIPRHNEIEHFLAKKICKQLGIAITKKK